MLFGKKEPAVALLGIKVIRSHRRTMSLEITREGKVVIRAPYLFSERKIAKFVSEKKGWIKKKQAIIKKRVAEKPKRQFLAGENFLYLGKNYGLLLVTRKRPPLVLTDYFELSALQRHRAPAIFTRWYIERAKAVITPIVNRFAEDNTLTFKKLRFSGARTRWGSCTNRGHLSFSWRLIMAPEEVVAYVVVHELAHLEHHNHSKRFWKFVEKMEPSFRKQRQWLREHGHKLVID
ncbi:MAG: SprT family zinc-dependent metalloprotease [bacterium]|nr:SprT family zinc-dependent metalloprotease [bacterium]